MFSSSFTMSEQKHRQRTLYKHDAPALSGPLRSGTSCRPLRSRIWNLRCDLRIWVRGRREKCCAGNQNKAQHALPQEREAGERRKQICDAGSNAIPSGSPPGIRRNAPSRIARRESIAASEAFYYPSDKALYGTRCGHGEKAERDFNPHRIDEDGF